MFHPADNLNRALALTGGPQEGIYIIQPRHMCVNLPRNISDEDLYNPSLPLDYSVPLSVPTSMSYLIHRIKLAEVSRHIVDAMPLSPSTPDTFPYNDFIALDREFDTLLTELPPFFQPKPPPDSLPSNFTSIEIKHIESQRHMVHMTTSTRRSKFHQPYLIRGFTDSKYHHSRDVCLSCARGVVRMFKGMDRDGLSSTNMLRLSGMHHHLFFAGIALVMDLCFNTPVGGIGDKERKAEVREACRILEEAKGKSVVAKRFLAGLMGVLRRHGVSLDDDDILPCGDGSGDKGSWGVEVQETETLEIHSTSTQAMPDGADFEEIWQMYMDNAESENWEELFKNDLGV